MKTEQTSSAKTGACLPNYLKPYQNGMSWDP